MNIISAIRSYRTTILGICAVLVLILNWITNTLNNEAFDAVLAAIVAAIGISAKDGNKKSEDVGL